MVRRNAVTDPQNYPLKAALDFLQRTNEARDELQRDRENAGAAGQLDLVLQLSKDLRRCHGDYLLIGLRLVSIRRSQARDRIQSHGSGSTVHQFFTKILGLKAGEAAFKKWQEANEESEAKAEGQGAPVDAGRDPLMAEDFTPEAVGKEYSARMAQEKSFLERLKLVAQQAGNRDLVRGCRNELRDLDFDLFRGQTEIGSFEQDNPPPVDPLAIEAKKQEARIRIVNIVRDLAIDEGILSEDGLSLLTPEESTTGARGS